MSIIYLIIMQRDIYSDTAAIYVMGLKLSMDLAKSC